MIEKKILQFSIGSLLVFLITGILGLYLTQIRYPYWQNVKVQADNNHSIFVHSKPTQSSRP